MKLCTALLAMFSLAALIHAQDLDQAYNQLKDAQTKKDAAGVNKLAAEASKLAKAEEAKPQPADASAVDNWKQRVEFAKQVQTFAEYALFTTAISGTPAQTVELVDTLLSINPKSQYLNESASLYIAALGKEGGAAKQLAGAQKIVNAAPENEDALYALASGYMRSSIERAGTYATRLAAVLKSKAKPQGVSEADWNRKKSLMLGQAYYISGAAACTKQSWTDCDRDLREALPYVEKEPATAGPTYFYLGLANFKLGTITNDRARIQQAERYSEQSAAIPGPMQGQARTNAYAMRQQLAQPTR